MHMRDSMNTNTESKHSHISHLYRLAIQIREQENAGMNGTRQKL